jgi:hypothetical protein
MQHLLKPQVLSWATLAALGSALASYPRFLLWADRKAPLWFLETALFLCAVILWAFVFAWHRVYTRRLIFWVNCAPSTIALITVCGLVAGTVWHRWLDPVLRQRLPEEFSADLTHWLAATLFVLGFLQLFLTFAPFDWWMRLCRNETASLLLTALVGTGVVALKLDAKHIDLPAIWWIILLTAKFIGGGLTVLFYLRGGLLLAWWWALLIECRHLPDFF